MILTELLKNLPDIEFHGDSTLNITSITCDSRAVKHGTLFFALRGINADGHFYIEKAVAAGAAAVVLEDSGYAPANTPWLKTSDSRSTMGKLASIFNGEPTASKPLIGITGTNGKTTTTYLIEAILEAAGIPAAVLGTISYRFGSKSIAASHTTPESTELQSAFRELAETGAKAFVMEVSSHALEQKRVDGCHFDVGIFSNLTRDHLDYHGDMENYLSAKTRLFSELLVADEIKKKRFAAINMDDPYGARVSEKSACPVITFGREGNWDVCPVEVELSVKGISGVLKTPKGEFPFASRLLGRFNLSNILAAVAAGIALDFPLTDIKAGIEGHKTVPGRMESVENICGVTCLVDYAHTGDALENVLATIREIAAGRVITVFGCGGDRDNGKRPVMGRIAALMSDLAIVTSDNPRTENPLSILKQIEDGITPLGICKYSCEEDINLSDHKGYIVVENRQDAIRLAIRLAKAGDVVLLAGKGHEDYQIIGA
ncbi:MAG: UDP-N-acetylmuramoyl-L-alanyl-D-glutamate--2,6-diaminopimelate ligase, partial [Desulfuromonadaceae bacterium]|nr:UDP-N-acetylmuramoyl-L-alanyl-D-glutamate--2,6-diaminopimelate ligase [Desulfuromonadaceae bacterium]